MAKCCDFTSGMMREPVTFEQQGLSSIGGGASDVTYSTRFTTRGYFKPLSGREVLHAERLDAQTQNRLVIRYRSDVEPSDRVIVRNRAYNIRFINNVEFRDKWLEINLDGGVAT